MVRNVNCACKDSLALLKRVSYTSLKLHDARFIPTYFRFVMTVLSKNHKKLPESSDRRLLQDWSG